MTRSKHNGCGGPCGLCRPHKAFPSNALEDRTIQERRVLQEGIPEPGVDDLDPEDDSYLVDADGYCDCHNPRPKAEP